MTGNTPLDDQSPPLPAKSRITLAKFLFICLPLWLSIKFYEGPYHDLAQHYLAGILFIIIWALIVQLAVPRLGERPLLVALFLFFSAVELLAWQQPELFAGLSVSIAGQQIMGGNFSVHRIPYYGVGIFIGYYILRACRTA